MIFVALGLDFTFRLVMERPRRIRQHVTLIEGHTAAESSERGTRKRWLVLLAAVFFSVAMLVMRAVYRTVDYAKGECGQLDGRIEADLFWNYRLACVSVSTTCRLTALTNAT